MNFPREAFKVDDWAGANQRWLVQRFAQLRVRIASGAAGVELNDDAIDGGIEPAHTRLVRLFGLSPFEGELLLLAAGIECDDGLREAVGQTQGQAEGTSLRLQFALAMRCLHAAHWDALSPLGPLRRWPLLHLDAQVGLARATLRIDERVLHYLTGVAAFDERLHGLARWIDASPEPRRAHDGPVDNAQAQRIAQCLARHPRPLVMIGFAPHQARQRAAARTLALAALDAVRLRALWVDVAALDSDPRALADTARAIDREAALGGAAVVLAAAADGSDNSAALLRAITQLRSPLLLLGSLPAAELADLPERRAWRFGIRADPHPPSRFGGATGAAVRRATQQFHVDGDTLDQALEDIDAAGDTDAEADTDRAPNEPALWQALREAARGGLDGLAQRVETRTRLADLVLPPASLQTLGEIATQVRHRARVHEDWGFAAADGRGLGLAALFSGDSGTGKTCAAEALANETGLDLYRIDLAAMVSKYIGETEKNLRKLFDAAEASGAVLLFDEADALFGKRSDVKDSHDRYANIEVAYLLQRIESYRGLAILTTNLKSSLDRAFLRRLRFVVNFPFPDEAARATLWRRQFPAQAPLAGDIDWTALTRLHLTGGHIRAVALNAAFRAAAESTSIAHRHLIEAARAEYNKLERSFGVVGAAP